MLNLSEIASSTEERVLTGVKAGQTMVLDGLKNTVALADRVLPASIGDRIEDQATSLPAAAPVIEGYFGFATKMLEAQRDFVGEIVEIFQPTVAKKAPAKKAAAKRAPAKKVAAKKAA
jgi:hypothetical protein